MDVSTNLLYTDIPRRAPSAVIVHSMEGIEDAPKACSRRLCNRKPSASGGLMLAWQWNAAPTDSRDTRSLLPLAVVRVLVLTIV